MNAIKALEAEQMKQNVEEFRIGDTVKVHYKIIEGKTERVQVFEGIVLAMKRDGLRKTFTVRKISYGVGVERIFPSCTPPGSQKSSGCGKAKCAARSCTTCAAATASPRRSRS